MHKALLYHGGPARALMNQSDLYSEARRKGEVVHSGHFMISSVADDQEEVEEIDHNRDSPVHHEQSIMIKYGGYDFSNVAKETKDTYQFGPLPSKQITIDASLARLFRCMSLAYRGGKVVSPKWKNFKGMKLSVKDKIRLNNAIWRTWHIQYVMKKKKYDSLIQFATPFDLVSNSHAKPEAVVMEGKYWKRRIETVVAEYKKWRAFFMEKPRPGESEQPFGSSKPLPPLSTTPRWSLHTNPQCRMSSRAALKLSDYPGLMWVTEEHNAPPLKVSNDMGNIRIFEENLNSDFTDSLFSNLSHQPFHFPNPREIAMHATNSDMMQPGLLQLQPTMDDLEFDPFQELLTPSRKPILSFTGAPTQPSSDIFQIGDLTQIPEENNMSTPQYMRIVSTLQAPIPQAPMDFVDTFTEMQRQDNVPMLQEPASTDDSLFTPAVATSAFYPPTNTDRVQHIQPQPNRLPQSTVMNNNVPSTHFQQQPNVKRYHGGQIIQQQPTHPPVPSTSIDATFVPIQNSMNVGMNGSTIQQPAYYPHSKHVISTPANNIITYSLTQTHPSMDYLSQNHMHQQPQPQQQSRIPVLVESKNLPVMKNEQMHPAHTVGRSMPLQTARSNRKKVEYNNVQAVPLQQQPTNNMVADTMLLKKLLASKAQSISQQSHQQSALQPQTHVHHRKRNLSSGSGSSRQSQKQVQQYSPKPVHECQKQSHRRTPSNSSNQHKTSQVVEKRKSVEDPISFFDGRSADIWPNKRRPSSSSNSPVKSFIQDVDMDLRQSLEPVSSLPQDNDTTQMDSHYSLSTEQKRRFNIKVAFSHLQSMLPGMPGSSHSQAKVSKATLLSKTAHYIKTMQAERAKIKEEMETLKKDLEKLHLAINSTQLELPASGAAAPRPQAEEGTKRFHAWTRHRTKQDWKFSIFSMVIEPWFNSYHKSVTVGGSQEFCKSLFVWVEDQCSLRVLRPSVVRSLQVISTTTCILTNPSQLRHQIEASVKDEKEEAGHSSIS